MDRRHELEAMTRDELLALAREAGVDGADWLSRDELVALLGRASSAPRASGFFEKARALIDKAKEIGKSLGRASRLPDPPASPHPDPVPGGAVPGRGGLSATETDTAQADTKPHTGEADTETAGEASAEKESGPDTTAPSPRASGERGRGEGPQFDTLTMAEVHASQGLVEEARRIVEAILAREPDNAEAQALLGRLAGRDTSAPVVTQVPHEEPRTPGHDAVSLVLVAPERLFCSWEITPEGRAVTQQRLAEPGRLVLRHATATGAGVATRDEDVHGGAEVLLGELFLAAAPDARHRVAVGLLGAGGRFVPIAHSGCVSTPRSASLAETTAAWGGPVTSPGLGPPATLPRASGEPSS